MFSFLKQGNSIQTYNKKVRTLFTFYTIAFNLLLSIIAIVLTVIVCKGKASSILQANTSDYANKVNMWFSEYTAAVSSTADIIECSANVTDNSIQDLLSALCDKPEYSSATSLYVVNGSDNIISSKSRPYVGNKDVITQEWYIDAVKRTGEVIVTSPYLTDNKRFITLSKSFTLNGETSVLALEVSIDELDKYTNESKSGKQYCFLVDNEYNIISHPNEDLVLGNKASNTLDKVSDGSYKKIFDLASKSSSDVTSTSDYDGSSKLGYTYTLPMGWTIVGVIPHSTIYLSLYIIIIVQIIVILVNIVLLNTIVSNKISTWFLPLLSISNKVDCLATGDLTVRFDENIVSSEIEILAKALNKTTENLNIYISDIKDVLKNLSDCKLNVTTSDCYEGDFNDIKESLDSIIANLNDVFTEINDTALGVSYNAEHMQASSQELAAGVTEQSEYIKDMFGSIEKLSVLIKTTANNSIKASDMADKSSTLLAAENEDMIDLLKSMDEIKESSKQIGAIINTINEIADQTDLLALNASIEASRAGEAGKSFAVIAGEVGSLARDSAEAVNTITELITNSTKAVNKGVEIANKTAEHLSEAVTYSNESKSMIDEISSAANTQSNEISKINSHVSQISGVTENNQAAAQENFAISDEASNQAQLLKSMVDKFDLQQ